MSMTAKLVLVGYVLLFVTDGYFQIVNGTKDMACIDFNGDGNPGVCLVRGDYWDED